MDTRVGKSVFPNIFVTVGTTSFDRLIELVKTPETLQQMKNWKTEQVKVQIGSSKVAEEGSSVLKGIGFTFYRYKNSLEEDMKWADLIICHAGAGTTLDALDSGKIICVIPNDSLMDNHQSELADCISEKGYGFSTKINQFHDVAPKISAPVTPFPKSNINGFLQILETDLLKLDINEVNVAKKQYEEKLQKKSPVKS